jgi:hypothetical protein
MEMMGGWRSIEGKVVKLVDKVGRLGYNGSMLRVNGDRK